MILAREERIESIRREESGMARKTRERTGEVQQHTVLAMRLKLPIGWCFESNERISGDLQVPRAGSGVEAFAGSGGFEIDCHAEKERGGKPASNPAIGRSQRDQSDDENREHDRKLNNAGPAVRDTRGRPMDEPRPKFPNRPAAQQRDRDPTQ